MCMRTNIVINDDLFKEAETYSAHHTKKEIIEEALITYITVKEREKRLRSYKERISQIENKTRDLVLREKPSRILRESREHR